jgi:hypothetical protein
MVAGAFDDDLRSGEQLNDGEYAFSTKGMARSHTQYYYLIICKIGDDLASF